MSNEKLTGARLFCASGGVRGWRLTTPLRSEDPLVTQPKPFAPQRGKLHRRRTATGPGSEALSLDPFSDHTAPELRASAPERVSQWIHCNLSLDFDLYILPVLDEVVHIGAADSDPVCPSFPNRYFHLSAPLTSLQKKSVFQKLFLRPTPR
jgi:hypothetical protein